jgi:predicted membrane chloride channel (bestrophin family)
MVLYPAAMMVNLRRLHRHLTEEAEKAAQEAVFSLSSLKTALCHCLKSIHRRFSSLTPQSTPIST